MLKILEKNETHLFLILILSCMGLYRHGKDLAVTLQIDRRIHNNSGVDVEVRSYFNALYDNNEKRYTIKNGEEYLESSAFLIPEEVGGGMPKSDIEWTGSVDSTFVIFNQSKYHLHCSDLSIPGSTTYEENIILGLVGTSTKNRGYELIASQKNYREYRYTITPEDYDKAKACDGHCD